MSERSERIGGGPHRGWVSSVLAALMAAGCTGEGGCPRVEAPAAGPEHELLLRPTDVAFAEQPPDTFHVRFETTDGEFVIESIRDWAPAGATRFYNLVRQGFYDGGSFFRVVPGFVVQFGASPVPAVQRAWDGAAIPDDSVRHSNVRGTVTFASAGPDTRTTQLFVNYGDNSGLDARGFAPIGRVVEGMDVLLGLYSRYGDFAPRGNAPDYGCMLEGGGAYIETHYPELDRIERATIVARVTG